MIAQQTNNLLRLSESSAHRNGWSLRTALRKHVQMLEDLQSMPTAKGAAHDAKWSDTLRARSTANSGCPSHPKSQMPITL